jgi:hypothetical protein
MLRSLPNIHIPAGGVDGWFGGDKGDMDSPSMVQESADWVPFPVRWVPVEKGTRAMVLNRLCREAGGEILAFADDDCVLPANWLTGLSAFFDSHPEIGLVGGMDAYTGDQGAFGCALDWVIKAPIGGGMSRRSARSFRSQYFPRLWNMALQRNIAQRLVRDSGFLFNPSLSVHEDVDVGRRVREAGFGVDQARDVVVGHSRHTSWTAFLGRNFQMAVAARRLKVHTLPHRLIAALSLGLCSGPAFAWIWPALFHAWAAGAAMYGTVLAVSGVVAGILCRRSAAGAWVSLLLVSMHLARGFGYALEPAVSNPQGGLHKS